jgi:hypothetical protein
MSKLIAYIGVSFIIISLIIGTASAITYNGEITNVRLTPSPVYVGDPIYHHVTVQNTGDATLPYIVEVWYGDTKEDGNYDNLYIPSGSSKTETWESSGFSTPGTKKFTYRLYYDAPWPASNVLLDTYTQTVNVVASNTPTPTPTPIKAPVSSVTYSGSIVDVRVAPTPLYTGDRIYHYVTVKNTGTGQLPYIVEVWSGGTKLDGNYNNLYLSKGATDTEVWESGGVSAPGTKTFTYRLYYDAPWPDNNQLLDTYTKTVSIDAINTPAPVTTGSLSISSTPSGASIYIDGTYKGVTPTVISGISAGSHQVQLTRSGYYDYTRTASVTAGSTTTVSATLTSIPQTPVTGSLDISSNPSGASIYVDGTYKGVTPKVVSGLSTGTHSVKLTKNGYGDYALSPSVTAGGTTTVSATLSAAVKASAAPAPGSVDIESTPSGAEIYVDGVYRGVTPYRVSGLYGGKYKVTLSYPGYYEHTGYVTVIAGQTTEYSAYLSPISTPFSESTPVILLGLLMIAIVLPAGYFIHSRRNRNNRNEQSKTGGTRPPENPPGPDAGQTDRGQNVTASQGKADVSVQNSSVPSPIKPAHVVPVTTGGPAEVAIEPKISITLNHADIYADEWDRIGLTLVNTGTAPAFDITLTFSDDVETRLLRPVDLATGESITIEAGIKPRIKGKVPLEITTRYRDAGNQTYKQTTSFWLSVEPRNNSVPAGSPVPPSISRPITPRSLPQEMAERYTAAEYLGRGGFARVFKVQKPDGSWAALKIPISLDAATGKSFIAELQNWTSLIHENIVRVNDYNIMPIPYFELELCDGTLATLERPVPPAHAAWLLFNVCEGLKYAHARGILHRDLKPQNIMLRDGIPKISDWGLSKVMTQSRTTTASGGFTAHYAAPEQITNKPKDERTDIWQLGVILYELVTGQLPFAGESMVEIGMAIATKVPERPSAVHPDAEPLDTIILKCLEKIPEQRYQSVADLQKALAAYLKMNYVESLKESIQANDLQRSAYYCGDLVLISMKIGDLAAAYKYAVDLARYSAGEVRAQAIELAKQIKMRVEMGAQDLPDELVQKAGVIVHQVRVR